MIKTLLLTSVVAMFANNARADEKTDAAVVSAKGWLAWVDAKDYKKSWQEAAPFFRDKVKEKQWEGMAGAVRNPLGKMELECSPRIDPSGMRVPMREKGAEEPHETQETQA